MFGNFDSSLIFRFVRVTLINRPWIWPAQTPSSSPASFLISQWDAEKLTELLTLGSKRRTKSSTSFPHCWGTLAEWWRSAPGWKRTNTLRSPTSANNFPPFLVARFLPFHFIPLENPSRSSKSLLSIHGLTLSDPFTSALKKHIPSSLLRAEKNQYFESTRKGEI